MVEKFHIMPGEVYRELSDHFTFKIKTHILPTISQKEGF